MTRKCKEIWENSVDFVEAFERISQEFPNCECEGCSASIHSQGTVSENETVIRRHFAPMQFNLATNEVDKHAYSDAYKFGLSVNRQSQITREELLAQRDQAIARSRESERKITKTGCGFAVATCEDIMNMRFANGRRMCCVYDTASEADSSHADVVYSGFRKGKKISSSEKEQLSRSMRDTFKIRDLDDIFPR